MNQMIPMTTTEILYRSRHMYLKGTVPILVVPCCSGKACPRNSQRGLIFDRDRPENSQRCPKYVHTYKHRDLWRVNKSSYTVQVPDLRILGAPPEGSSVETRTKNSKRKFIANAAHGTSSRPEDLGRVA